MQNDALSEDRPHICIGWSAMGNLSDVATKDDLAVMHDAVWPDSKSRAKGQNVGQIWRFIKEMNIGDYVVFAEDDVCHIGQVTSDYYYDETSYPNQSEDYTNVRNVKWLKTNIKRSELSKSFHYSLRPAMSVWGLNDYKSAIYELLNGTYIKDEVVEADDTEITAEEENIKKILPVLPKRTRKAFELNSILYGAPGTGKTYATAKYALAITEGKSLEEYNDVTREDIMSKYNQLVKDGLVVFTTFHQNYGYEDFIQGIRPDTSTNDMVCVMANGVAGNEEITAENADFEVFKQALYIVMMNLTKMLAKDGEGATKLLECTVSSAPDLDTGIIVAKSVICSPLFKCAMFGEDANWGRVLCAIGYAKADFEIDKVSVDLASSAGTIAVCRNGAGIEFSEEEAKVVLAEDEIFINVDLGQGDATAKAWGCDLTYDYVKINGDYRT